MAQKHFPALCAGCEGMLCVMIGWPLIGLCDLSPLYVIGQIHRDKRNTFLTVSLLQVTKTTIKPVLRLSCCCSLAMLSLSCLLFAACTCISFSFWPKASFSCCSWFICFACWATCCFNKFKLLFKSSIMFFSSSLSLSWSSFTFPDKKKKKKAQEVKHQIPVSRSKLRSVFTERFYKTMNCHLRSLANCASKSLTAATSSCSLSLALSMSCLSLLYSSCNSSNWRSFAVKRVCRCD